MLCYVMLCYVMLYYVMYYFFWFSLHVALQISSLINAKLQSKIHLNE